MIQDEKKKKKIRKFTKTVQTLKNNYFIIFWKQRTAIYLTSHRVRIWHKAIL